ncbi:MULTISPECIES: hypothetical protein [unclassified Actinopolyspora]|uniref:hypothetical protein n=1 Tax=unclassified Actinopolyspora TaxID=2639451 RepID=UPI0013F5EEC1|nr:MULTISPECIES: hypothetical protein [unclassified Actinopolyspora]NHD15728.1 hypothetical protein [Actinopolyspora sp. BKK2]NHE75058.1 hypothetical protein [Actinopolyspora sp. BKK1]
MSNSDTRGLLAGLGIGAALILCCAGPVLIAAGALGALAGIFSSPWLWAAAGVALVSAVALTAARKRSATHSPQDGSSSPSQRDDCCPPPDRHHDESAPSPQQRPDNEPTRRRFPR